MLCVCAWLNFYYLDGCFLLEEFAYQVSELCAATQMAAFYSFKNLLIRCVFLCVFVCVFVCVV